MDFWTPPRFLTFEASKTQYSKAVLGNGLDYSTITKARSPRSQNMPPPPSKIRVTQKECGKRSSITFSPFSGRFRSLFGHFFWCFCHFFARLLLPDSFCGRVKKRKLYYRLDASDVELFRTYKIEVYPTGRWDYISNAKNEKGKCKCNDF